MTEHVGWIGLGQLGLPMATNVVDAGNAMTVWNRTASKAAPLVARGAQLAEAAIGVAHPGGTIVTSLWDGAAVEGVVTPDLLERLRGGLHISTTTMLPATSKQLAERHAAHGVAFVEAPVFGRPEAAAAKQLAVPIAGSARDKDRARPVLAALGAAHVFDLGEAFGAALATKLAGNFMIVSAVRTFTEALDTAIRAGADPERVVDMLTSTLFAAPIYKSYGERLLTSLAQTGTVGTGFVSKIPEKDLGLFIETAGTLDTPIADLFHALVSGRADPSGHR
jgi:3-hydroxyisobutyrate dehydrogenase-like beta-hydroxyacid dehydrogenase